MAGGADQCSDALTEWVSPVLQEQEEEEEEEEAEEESGEED